MSGGLQGYKGYKLYKSINIVIRDFDAKSFSRFSQGVFNVSDIEQEFDVCNSISRIPDVFHIHDWYGVLWASAVKYQYNIPTIMKKHIVK